MLASLGLAGVGAGVLLMWSALANVSPVDVVRSVFDPNTERTPLRAASSGTPAPTRVAAPGGSASSPGKRAGSCVPQRTDAQELARLSEPLRSRARALMAEAGGRVSITSGLRTYAEQECLYAKFLAGTGNLAAVPGTSRHETGRAVDFGGDLALVAQLAPRYRLAATVPGEPWHYEPV